MKARLTLVAAIAALTLASQREIAAQVQYGYTGYGTPYGAMVPAPNMPFVSALETGPGGAACTDPGCTDPGCADGAGVGVAEEFGGEWECCPPRTFGSLEYLQWYNKGTFVPALATTANAPDSGVLGQATTRVLFGNGQIDTDLQAGARLTVGTYLDDEFNLALVGKVYGLESGAVRFDANTTAFPRLARPFFNSDALVNGEDALLVGAPAIPITGSLSMRAENDMFGGELLGRSLLDMGGSYRVDLIGGYQFTRMDSDLIMTSTHTAGATRFNFSDVFDVDNQYHAGTVGLASELYRGMWTLSSMGKIGLGNMHQVVDIRGNNTVTVGNAAGVTTNGGLFAQNTNIGNYTRDILSWSPEVNFKLSCAVTQTLSISVGYTFLYFTRVSFAGDQIDRNVNATQLNGGAVAGVLRPQFAFRDTDYWVQTVDIGLNWTY